MILLYSTYKHIVCRYIFILEMCAVWILSLSHHMQFIFLLNTNAVGDGREGYTDLAPFDAIHVGAAAPHIPQAVSLWAGARECGPCSTWCRRGSC